MKLSTIRASLMAATAIPLVMTGTAALAQSRPAAPPLAEISVGLDENNPLGSLDLFLPFMGGFDKLFFGDVRVSFGGEEQVAMASLGLGYRTAIGETWTLGINGYYDYLSGNGTYDNDFHQLGIGVEALSQDWELRANAYLPMGDVVKAVTELNAVALEAGRLVFRAGEETAMRGVEGEIGYRLPLFAAEDPMQLKAFAGGYWYTGDHVEDVPGVAARVEFSRADLPHLGRGSRLTLVAGATYDDQRDFDGTLLARLRIPLGDSAAMKPDDLLYRRVERTDEIRTYVGSTGTAETAILEETGGAVGRVVTINDRDTAAGINGELAAAGNNALVLASGTINLDSTLQLTTNSHLTSGGRSFVIRGAQTGGTAIFRVGGSQGTLNGTNPTADVVAMANGSTISDLAINGGRDGISATNVGNVQIRNVSISNTARNGISASGVSGLQADNIVIAGAAGSGVVLENIQNTRFTNLAARLTGGADGIVVDGASGLQFSNVGIAGNVGSGFVADDVADLTVTNLSLSGLNGSGVVLSNATGARFSGVGITAEGAAAPAPVAGMFALAMAPVPTTGGIILTDVEDVQFSNVGLSLTGGDALALSGADNVQFSNVVILGDVGTVFSAFNATNLAVDDLTAVHATGTGISLTDVQGAQFSNVGMGLDGGDAIWIAGGGNLQFANLAFSGSMGNAFTAFDAADITVDSFSATGVGGNGVALFNVDSARFSNIALALTGGSDAIVADNVSQVQFDRLGLSGSFSNGINLVDADGVSISNAAITGGTGHGIVASGVENIEISNVAISDVGGDGVFVTDATGIQITGADISQTGNHGIQLANVDGALIASTRIHNLARCEDNTDCEWSIFNPNVVYNAGISALSVQNLTVRDVAMEDVTYGLFVGSAYEEIDWENVIVGQSGNLTVENLSLVNSRREGVLLVGVDTASLTGVSIDNSAMDRSMDLIVLQKSAHITLDQLDLKGGINGLMFASSFNLPGATTDISVSDVRIEDTFRAGVFMNPTTDVSFTNLTIVNPGSYGFYIYGDAYGFAGGPINNISFNEVSVSGSGDAAVYVSGPIANFNGDIATENVPTKCSADPSPWSGTELTQDAGYQFSIGGSTVPAGTLAANCGL